jgi:hypothetical protein
MATTATVNKKKKKKGAQKKRRRNPTRHGAATSTPRRRPAAPARRAPARRASNRRSNPDLMNWQSYWNVMPPATGGVVAGRIAVKLAGPFEDGKPGFAHAIAGVIGVNIGAKLVGNMFRSPRSEEYAFAGGLGYVGELFLRKRFFVDQPWYMENVSLEGDNDAANYDEYMEGGAGAGLGGDYEKGSVLALPDGSVVQVLAGVGQEQFTDPAGNQWVQTGTGWQMGGNNGSYASERFLEEPIQYLPGGSGRMGGFQQQSALGTARPASTSFGYSR